MILTLKGTIDQFRLINITNSVQQKTTKLNNERVVKNVINKKNSEYTKITINQYEKDSPNKKQSKSMNRHSTKVNS